MCREIHRFLSLLRFHHPVDVLLRSKVIFTLSICFTVNGRVSDTHTDTVWKASAVLDSDGMALAVQQVVGLWVSGLERREERQSGVRQPFTLLCSGAAIKDALLRLRMHPCLSPSVCNADFFFFFGHKFALKPVEPWWRWWYQMQLINQALV